MQYLNEDQVSQMMGIGYLGEVRQGPDGNVYQYVQGVDGLGNPIGGIWSRAKRWTRRAARRALPYVRQFAPLVPGVGPAVSVLTSPIPVAPAVAPVMTPASPPVQATEAMPPAAPTAAAPAETGTAGWGIGEDEMTQMMGIGYLGEVRQGPDGSLYQYVQGVDGLGNPIGGFWSKLKRGLKAVHRVAQRGASFIPGPYGAAIRAGLKIATPILQKAGVAGYNGLGALYQAPDGTLYQQVQGVSEDEELRGLAEDEELRGLDEDEELRGVSEEEELRGLDEDEELRGLDADEELQGFAEDDELRGVAEEQEMQGIDGYVRQDGMSGLEAYVPQESPQTRWHVTPAQTPEVWKTLW
jgi:hypothetical protein